MKDLILHYVTYEKNGSCWKKVKIKKIGVDGRCAVCTKEKIGENDLYYYDGEIYHPKTKHPPTGSLKVICVHFWFKDISTKVNQTLKIECESILVTNEYKIKWPLKIKSKNS